VSLRTEIDPALIGGLTVRVGDRLLDASVRGRLQRLRGELLAGSRQAHG
jgi:F-type H+-transporting ATPase subunit delta